MRVESFIESFIPQIEDCFKVNLGDLDPILRIKEGEDMPDRFRKIDGISGSGQPSKSNFKNIIEHAKEKKLLVIDLRREFHGFINGNPISWQIDKSRDKHYYNKIVSPGEIENKEHEILSKYLFNKTVRFETNQGSRKILIENISTERELVESLGGQYVRAPILDLTYPDDQTVDLLVSTISKLPKDMELHLHCAAGRGRTTICWAMIDIMQNPKHSLDDILKDQRTLKGGSDLSLGDERYEFLKQFCQYCKENPTFSIKWSEWNKQKSIFHHFFK